MARFKTSRCVCKILQEVSPNIHLQCKMYQVCCSVESRDLIKNSRMHRLYKLKDLIHNLFFSSPSKPNLLRLFATGGREGKGFYSLMQVEVERKENLIIKA